MRSSRYTSRRDPGRARPRPYAPGVERMEDRRLLASLTVTTAADSGPGSLRDAIALANTDPALDTIRFAPAVTGAIALQSALPELTTAIVLEGPGASVLTVAGGPAPGTPAFRIVTVAAGAEVAISGLSLTGGRADSGGGILNRGTMTVTASTLSGNSAFGGSGGFAGGSGGGIFNSGTLTVTASTLSGNSAEGSRFSGGIGGAISNSGTVTITASTLSGNTAGGTGGGIFNGGTMAITASTLSGNSAVAADGSGGGISNGGTMTVTASTLSGNSASGVGVGAAGGIGSGGGISNTGTMTVTASTLSGNEAISKVSGGGGGGISNSGTLTVIASTLSGNSAFVQIGGGSGGGIDNRSIPSRTATLTIHTSLFANGAGGNLVNTRGAVTSLGHNLFTDTPAVPLDPTDLLNTDPLLAPLADYGGPTLTHALLPGSPAIDSGSAVPGLATDQRGVARPQGPAPDIGAFESRGFVLARVAGDNQSTPASAPFPDPLVVSVSSPSGEPVAGGRVTFTAPTAGASANFIGNPATITATGLAGVNAMADGLPGTFRVTARAAGAENITFTLTNTAPPPPAPTVVSLQRFGSGARPTRLVLTFNTPLDPGRAGRLANYRLVAPGRDQAFGTRDDRAIRLRSVVVGPDARTVTLTPGPRLGLRGRRFLLAIDGTAPDGLTDAAGNPLDGDRDGRPGGDFATTFGAERFVPASPLRIPRTVAVTRRIARSRVPAGVFVTGTSAADTTLR
jgi:hypothetical protein